MLLIVLAVIASVTFVLGVIGILGVTGVVDFGNKCDDTSTGTSSGTCDGLTETDSAVELSKPIFNFINTAGEVQISLISKTGTSKLSAEAGDGTLEIVAKTVELTELLLPESTSANTTNAMYRSANGLQIGDTLGPFLPVTAADVGKNVSIDASGKFILQADVTLPNTAGHIITHKAPSALTTGYSITWPTEVPTAGKFLQVGSTGIMSFVSSGGGGSQYTIIPGRDLTATGPLQSADAGTLLSNSTGGAITLQIGDEISIGDVFYVQQGAGGIITLGGAATLNSLGGNLNTAGLNSFVTVLKTAASTYSVYGDLAA